eukprot:TRINITY_DN39847_c0_g1_i1.p1 TRINITY_DN39847_c0_g1~~TRINITY_DN39847_c0_g1_i1.p1  ORF type:complete len:950 (-),score=158.17 TRINITY_DN39847_c0_g1_i1:79-2847(-)
MSSNEDFASDQMEKQFSGEKKGPLDNRSCRDIICLVLWILHIGGFFVASFLGVRDGNPHKLYLPRDYKGDYCGAKDQWNDGSDRTKFPKLVRMLNVTAVVDKISKELICSTIAERRLMQILPVDELETYMCGCCKISCPRCAAVYEMNDPATPEDLFAMSGSQLADFTDRNSAAGLIASGKLGQIMQEVDKNFIRTCVASCDDVVYNGFDLRKFTYMPDFNDELRNVWKVLIQDDGVPEIKEAISTQFTFDALPKILCDYEPRYCVPVPGMTFSELSGGYCGFALSEEMAQAAGQSAAATEMGEASLSSFMGILLETLDVFSIVFAFSFVSGIILMVLIRFLVGCFVWFALAAIVTLTGVAGVAAYVKSGQCVGVTMSDAARAYHHSAKTYGKDMMAKKSNQYAGTEFQVLDLTHEHYTGNAADYHGMQDHTVSGRKCQMWNSSTPHEISWYLDQYPEANLTKNHCRNFNDAIFMWCYTQDPNMRWEICHSLDTTAFHQMCPTGYVIQEEWQRTALHVIAVVLWVLTFVQAVMIICLFFQIRKAIAILKSAALFVIENPQAFLVPILEAMLAFLWLMFWCFCASFALSQVPPGYTPTEMYATYTEAAGTDDIPGNCTAEWPPNGVYKYAGNLEAEDDPCSGNKGDISGITPKCWACSPPRYQITTTFWYLLFSFLWNNALLAAFLQIIVAGAVATWFFCPFDENKRKDSNAVSTSVRNAFRYHFGSVCFGSLLVAIIQFIRCVLKYMELQAQQAKNRVMVMVFRALQCVLLCFERYIKFINRTAYITISITGESFCTAAWHGFTMILRHMGTFAALFYLGRIIRYVGMGFVMTSTAIVGYYTLQAMAPEINPVGPVILYVVLGWMVGDLFVGVFNLAVDTILFSLIIVEDKGYNAVEFAPSPLLSIVEDLAEKSDSDKKPTE